MFAIPEQYENASAEIFTTAGKWTEMREPQYYNNIN